MIPEEAVVDAIRSEHLAAAQRLVQLANRDSLSMALKLLTWNRDPPFLEARIWASWPLPRSPHR